ncbi:nucleotidyltransferase family protein [Aurantiacibacter gilvus]|uniref:NTP transferase domain-containing protein n=1 Tax=Aurantiacibacter gilvus TaxID=3139141 RepID=A0ABU9IET3_9SPHN
MPEQPLVAVLAAGRGSRFGGGKLDVTLAGKPLGRWVLDAVKAAGLEPGVIVVGPDVPHFATAAAGWQLVTNPDPEAGQAGSVALAAAAAAGRALLVALADMPLVDPDHLRRLAASGGNAATRYPDGRLGVPACVAAEHVGKLEVLTGDRGAGPILSGLPDLAVIEADPDTLFDVDTPKQLAQVAERLSR